jgi:hypothetical protein
MNIHLKKQLKKMQVQKVKINSIKSNPKNPRLIKDDKFKKLVNSIKKFPQMLELRPIVVDENNFILGGNMRHKACIEAGLKEVFIVQATNLTELQKDEFIVKDNVGFGEWNWDILANEWDATLLNEWGLEIWNNDEEINLDDFFEENNDPNEKKFNIILEYSEEEYAEITELFKNYSGTKEKIVFDLLKS